MKCDYAKQLGEVAKIYAIDAILFDLEVNHMFDTSNVAIERMYKE